MVMAELSMGCRFKSETKLKNKIQLKQEREREIHKLNYQESMLIQLWKQSWEDENKLLISFNNNYLQTPY